MTSTAPHAPDLDARCERALSLLLSDAAAASRLVTEVLSESVQVPARQATAHAILGCRPWLRATRHWATLVATPWRPTCCNRRARNGTAAKAAWPRPSSC
jgi:hypothetical protein